MTDMTEDTEQLDEELVIIVSDTGDDDDDDDSGTTALRMTTSLIPGLLINCALLVL